MNELPDNSIHLMVTSLPYNIGKDYDDLTEDDYLHLLSSVWHEVCGVLAPGGRACINVANQHWPQAISAIECHDRPANAHNRLPDARGNHLGQISQRWNIMRVGELALSIQPRFAGYA